MLSRRPDDVLHQPKESDHKWSAGQPLSGFDRVSVGVKEMVLVGGHTLSFGSKWCCDSENIIVASFRQAGARILGVTVSSTTEGGVTPPDHSLAFDGPLNAYNIDNCGEGLSSRAAVIVAAGLAPATGFDRGGGIRVPARRFSIE